MIELFEKYKNFLLLCAGAFVSLYIARYICLPIFKQLAKKTKSQFDDFLVKHKAIERFAHIIPAIVLYRGLSRVLDVSTDFYQILSTLNNVYFIIVAYLVYDAILRALADIILHNPKKQGLPIQGVRQAALLIGFLVCSILVISQITGKSPVILLSGLGALAAVFMLVFKDSILGFTAGIQIATQDLVRTGDWIEVPKEGINGVVEYVFLTSIRIRNWDNTKSILPAYALVATPFKNWRYMQDSGRRCLQRSIFINGGTIGYLSSEQINELKKDPEIQLIFDSQLKDLSEKKHVINIQLFRQFATTYIRSLDQVDPSLTLFVREKESIHGYGIPLEFYLFTTVTDWAAYESFGSDIADYLQVKLPAFGLELYQKK